MVHGRSVSVLMATLVSTSSCCWAQQCPTDGSGYSYSESISTSTNTRTIVSSGCPSHTWTNLNPNYPITTTSAYQVPSQPMYDESREISLSEQGGATGILFSAAQVYSAYGGSTYGEATAYSSGAPWVEGDTFDECGGHASSTSHSSYHVHVPPTCLLKQLNADNSQHSPQIGWSLDGFPIYGPRGNGGLILQTCSLNNIASMCLDDCGGFKGEIDLDGEGTSDGYKYRYYILGEKSSADMCTQQDVSCAEFWPHTPICMRGCIPETATGGYFNRLLSCSANAEDGYTTIKPAQAPGLSFMATPSCPESTDAGCAVSTKSGAARTKATTIGALTTFAGIFIFALGQ